MRERRFQTIATAVIARVVDILSSFLNPKGGMGVDFVLGSFALDTFHNEVRQKAYKATIYDGTGCD